ncbi:MAG: TonB-dependent receptor domain-containing protein [Pseudomonadales bacterium]
MGAGRHEADFFIRNTVNASLGPNTPTEFDPGAYTQLDKTLNIDISKGFDVGFASDLNVAGGFEWRNEEFEITVGDPASFEIGPLAGQGFSAASNGFAGFSNLAGGEWDRTNIAFYADLEANITEAWLVGLALRWEDFNDFGTTTNGKIATNFAFTDNISVRGSYSTGFRAPTPGQSNAFNVSTEFDSVTNDLVNNGFVPPTNPASVLKGGQQLEPEESVNWTAGIILQLGEVSVTVDYFNIELTDRIAPSQNFTLTEEEVQLLIDSGVTSAGNLAAFRFFTNDFDTTTSGFDVVATWGTSMLGGNTDFSLAYNNTETEVDSFSPEIVEETRIKELEEGLPETRWNVSATHNMDAWRFMIRASYYDEFFDSEDDLTYGDEYIVDAEVAYTFNEKYTVTVGAQNLLDEFPDENPGAASGVGNQYSQFSPSGFGGGFYYLRLNLDF